jgi:predicted O-methyltransferase YrrM
MHLIFAIMNAQRRELLEQLAALGQAHDQQATHRAGRFLNITPETGPFLALLLKATHARDVLEIGTSNGYSTIWLADAVQPSQGHVTTIEVSAAKVALATANFELAGLTAAITQVHAPAEDWLPTGPAAAFDFIFLDSDRSQYAAWWPWLLRLLRPGGLLVADNASSHPADFLTFNELVRTTPGVERVLVPLGKGELLIWKE